MVLGYFHFPINDEDNQKIIPTAQQCHRIIQKKRKTCNIY